MTQIKKSNELPVYTARVLWSGGLSGDDWGNIFDLDAWSLIGNISPTEALGTQRAVTLGEASGTSLLGFPTNVNSEVGPPLTRYSRATLQPIASGDLSHGLQGPAWNLSSYGANSLILQFWGTDGLALINSEIAVFTHISGLEPIASPPPPTPTTDASGAIHLSIPTAGLVFDSPHNLVWASIPTNGGSLANSVISIDPASGTIRDTITAVNNPGALAISDDGSRLYIGSTSVSQILPVNLTNKTRDTPIPVSGGTGAWYATSLVPLSGQPNSVAALLIPSNAGNDSRRSVTVYDGSVPRPQVFTGPPDNATIDTLVRGDAPASLYAVHVVDPVSQSLYRLTIGSNGVAFNRQWNTDNLTLGAYFAFANGYLYTSSGLVWTSQGSLAGRVADDAAIPVPFPERNLILYVSQIGSPVAVSTFDISTLQPLASLQVNVVNPTPQYLVEVTSAVRAGSNAVAFGTASEVVIVPLSAPTPPPTISPAVKDVAPGVQQFTIPVYAIARKPGTAKLLIATPSTALNLGNSLMTLDPSTGNVDGVTLVGSEPTRLTISADGSTAYTYLAGQQSIARVDLASGVRNLVFSTDFTGANQAFPIWHMALGPDGGLAVTYQNGAVAIFDNGIPRPQIYGNTTGILFDPSVQFHLGFDSSGTRLYSSAGDIWSVSPAGLQFLSSLLAGGLNGFGHDLQVSGGLIYSTAGYAFDPERAIRVGQFEGVPAEYNLLSGISSNRVLPDPASGRVYFVAGSQLLVYDMFNLALLGSLPLPSTGVYSGFPLSIVKFSDDGLAVNTLDGALYLVRISAIPTTGPNCSYGIDQTGQAFPATGGEGSLNIAASSGCAWTVSHLPSWVTVPGGTSGVGNATLTYEVSANSGGARSATFAIGGFSYTLEQQAAAIAGLNFVGSISHIAAEENWTTTLTLVNKSGESCDRPAQPIWRTGELANSAIEFPTAILARSAAGGHARPANSRPRFPDHQDRRFTGFTGADRLGTIGLHRVH